MSENSGVTKPSSVFNLIRPFSVLLQQYLRFVRKMLLEECGFLYYKNYFSSLILILKAEFLSSLNTFPFPSEIFEKSPDFDAENFDIICPPLFII